MHIEHKEIEMSISKREADIELVKAFADAGDKMGMDKVSALPIPAPSAYPVGWAKPVPCEMAIKVTG